MPRLSSNYPWLTQHRQFRRNRPRPHVEGHTVVDNTDPEALVAASREVAAAREVTGVFCYDEGLVWPAAHVVEALDLPGTRPDGIRACRDKDLTRRRLDAAGVAQP